MKELIQYLLFLLTNKYKKVCIVTLGGVTTEEERQHVIDMAEYYFNCEAFVFAGDGAIPSVKFEYIKK